MRKLEGAKYECMDVESLRGIDLPTLGSQRFAYQKPAITWFWL